MQAHFGDRVQLVGSLVAIFHRRFYWLLSACILLALLLRVLALLSYQHSIYSEFLIWDESVFHNWAMQIVQGRQKAHVVSDFAPLPAYFMVLLYKIFSPAPVVFRIFNVIISTFSCYLIFAIGRQLANRSVGLLACFFATLYGPFIFFSFTILKTSLSVFLFAVVVYQFLSAHRQSSRLSMVLIGVAVGLLLNVRPNVIFILIFLPLVLGWGWFRQGVQAKKILTLLVLYAIGLGLSIGPFIVRDYHESKEIELTVAGGFNLYIANNPQNPYPYYRPVSFASSVPSRQATHFIIEASRRMGQKLSAKQASSYFTGETVKVAWDDPYLLVRKICWKVLALFNRFEHADNYNIGFMSEYIRLFKLPFLTFWTILPLGMIGLVDRYRLSAKCRGLAGMSFFYGITLIIFFTNVRLRLVLLVILIPLAACGVESLWNRLRQGRSAKLLFLFLTGIFFLAITFLPIPGSDDLTGCYNTHAINLKNRGKVKEAISFWQISSGLNKPYSAYADVSLAYYYLRTDRTDLAQSYADKISPDSFAAAQKYELLGDIYRRRNMYPEACTAYNRSLSVNSALLNCRKKLIDLYRKINPQQAKKEQDILEYLSSFY